MVLYGLVAAASPTVLLATLVVLATGRGRLNGIVFAIAFVLGQTIAFVLALLVGSAITPDDGSSRADELIELGAGVLLIAFGWNRRRGTRSMPATAVPRSEALFERLSRVKPVVSFGIGLPLGVGAKRLIVTILAATTLAADTLSGAENVTLSVLYVGLATVVVWLPVLLYLVFGTRADRLIEQTRRWIGTHEDQVTTVSALAFGALLVADSALTLAL